MLHDQDLLSIQEVRAKVGEAYKAWEVYRGYAQERVDAVVEAAAAAGRAHALRLAELAVEETSYGNVRDKLAKNLMSADLLPRAMRGMKTVGLLRDIPEQKIAEYGVSLGVVAAVLPTTNPTSTAIFKTLISLKAGNAIVVSPHPHAKRSTSATVEVLAQAAVKAGAPEGLVQCVANPTMEGTTALMRHEKTAVILATGGSAMVKAAYSSGKPAFGVGPGNVPVLIDASAGIAEAVNRVVIGKSFDYGTVCSSEQTIVAEESLREPILAALRAARAYVCDEAQAAALGKLLITPAGTVSPRCVGQSPARIAQLAGFEVPSGTSIIAAHVRGVGKMHPLSAEKLSPVLALIFVKDFAAAVDTCEAILRFGGLGHTAVIYATDESRVREFGDRMPAGRVLVNTPSPQGSVGITTNLFPSMTLGCGAVAGNSTSDNVGPQHLINLKRVAWWVRRPEDALEIPDVPASKPVPAPPVDRQAVVAAVEKFLEQRGVRVAPSAPASKVIASPSPAIVNRFLSSKRPLGAGASGSCAAAGSCGCPVRAETPAAQPAAAPPPSPAPERAIEVVDFVCESDVREAVRNSRKIYIGPRTIVTPSAREVADAHDVLIMAQRS